MKTWEDHDPVQHKSPLKAIHEKCLDCCCWVQKEITLCTHTKCALFHFRNGKNPYRKKRVLSDAQREALRSHGFQKSHDNSVEKSNPTDDATHHTIDE